MNELDMNELDMSELDMNELDMNELDMNDEKYNLPAVVLYSDNNQKQNADFQSAIISEVKQEFMVDHGKNFL